MRIAAGVCATSSAPRRPRAWPAPTFRRAGGPRRPATPTLTGCARPRSATSTATDAGRAHAARSRPCGAPPRPRRRPQEVRGLAWLPPLQAARRGGDLAPLRRVATRFYEWVLGPSMAYTCAVYPTADATLEEAQDDEVRPRRRKLGLRAGHAAARRRLRLGRHGAARRQQYGVQAHRGDAVAQQAEWAQKAIADAGSGRPAPRSGTRTTATCPRAASTRSRSIGLTEHIGMAQLPGLLHGSCTSRLSPGGRLLNHCITRPDDHAARSRDARLHRPLRVPRRRAARRSARSSPRCRTNGFEIRHEENLREHYAHDPARLVRTTSTSTGTRRWPRSGSARPGCGGSTWPARGSASSATTIQLHQVLMVSPDEHGDANVPLRLAFDRG